MGGSIKGKFLFSNGRRRRCFSSLSSGVTQQKRAGISRNMRGERLVQDSAKAHGEVPLPQTPVQQRQEFKNRQF